MHIEPHAGILELRAALRDLVAISTIPAAWVGREPPAIAAGLADVLLESLGLDFAVVRLCVCAIPTEVPKSRRPAGTAGVDFPSGSQITSSRARFRVKKLFPTLAEAPSHVAVSLSPSASTLKPVWRQRHAVAPTFPTRLTSYCFRWQRITLQRRFRTRDCATSWTQRRPNSVKLAITSRRRWRNGPPICGGVRPT